MTKGWFIAGTDTGVGKTVVAAALTRRLVEQGERCAVMKPVASGCELVDHELRSADAETLRAESNVAADYETVNPYAFRPAIAPHIAAAEAGVAIDCECILAAYARLAAAADCVIVEGAGGWLVPLGDRRTQADLAAGLALPVVLVVGLRLGCLNHALLSAAAIAGRGLKLSGWVANEVDRGFTHIAENLHSLETRISAPLLGHVPHCGDGSPITHAARILDVARLVAEAPDASV